LIQMRMRNVFQKPNADCNSRILIFLYIEILREVFNI